MSLFLLQKNQIFKIHLMIINEIMNTCMKHFLFNPQYNEKLIRELFVLTLYTDFNVQASSELLVHPQVYILLQFQV